MWKICLLWYTDTPYNVVVIYDVDSDGAQLNFSSVKPNHNFSQWKMRSTKNLIQVLTTIKSELVPSESNSTCVPNKHITQPTPFQSAGSFEESALKGRLEPVATVHGFTASLGASGAFCPAHRRLPVTVFFYAPGGTNAPYMVCW